MITYVRYDSYSFSKPFEGKDISLDSQRDAIAPLDKICEESGGLFLQQDLGYVEENRLRRYYLVWGMHVEHVVHVDSSGSCPKNHGVGTLVKCVQGTENKAFLTELEKFYRSIAVPTWTARQSNT